MHDMLNVTAVAWSINESWILKTSTAGYGAHPRLVTLACLMLLASTAIFATSSLHFVGCLLTACLPIHGHHSRKYLTPSTTSDSSSNVPRPLPLYFRDSSVYVGKWYFIIISESVMQRSPEQNPLHSPFPSFPLPFPSSDFELSYVWGPSLAPTSDSYVITGNMQRSKTLSFVFRLCGNLEGKTLCSFLWLVDCLSQVYIIVHNL